MSPPPAITPPGGMPEGRTPDKMDFVFVYRLDDGEGEEFHGFTCPVRRCPFRSLGHEDPDSASIRFDQHAEEHVTGHPMMDVAAFTALRKAQREAAQGGPA